MAYNGGMLSHSKQVVVQLALTALSALSPLRVPALEASEPLPGQSTWSEIARHPLAITAAGIQL